MLYSGNVQLWRGDTYVKAERLTASGKGEQDSKVHAEAATGRQVQSIFKGSLPAGSYQRVWSGETSDGRVASAGVYFARMKTPGAENSVRAVFLGR